MRPLIPLAPLPKWTPPGLVGGLDNADEARGAWRDAALSLYAAFSHAVQALELLSGEWEQTFDTRPSLSPLIVRRLRAVQALVRPLELPAPPEPTREEIMDAMAKHTTRPL